jgi:hypothetical protein
MQVFLICIFWTYKVSIFCNFYSLGSMFLFVLGFPPKIPDSQPTTQLQIDLTLHLHTKCRECLQFRICCDFPKVVEEQKLDQLVAIGHLHFLQNLWTWNSFIDYRLFFYSFLVLMQWKKDPIKSYSSYPISTNSNKTKTSIKQHRINTTFYILFVLRQRCGVYMGCLECHLITHTTEQKTQGAHRNFREVAIEVSKARSYYNRADT